MLSLEDFEKALYKIDKSKLGSIYGGAQTTDPGVLELPGTSIEYSSDTKDGDTTTYHLCENGHDPNCENDPIVGIDT